MMKEKSIPPPASATRATNAAAVVRAPTPPSPSGASASTSSSSAAPRKGKLLRRSNSDRLRMHAPSSIQVDAPAAAAAAVSEWKLAIPLLSPLDYLDFASPWHPIADDGRAQTEEQQLAAEARGAADRVMLRSSKPWQHPAAPFYYDPPVASGNAVPFLFPQPQGV